jgi:enterochelin esterase-like enzyme
VGPTGLGTLTLALGLLAVVTVAAVLFWGRLARASAWVWPVRILLLVVLQVGAVAAAAVGVNRSYGFFTSWAELLGQHPLVESRAAQSGLLDAPNASLLTRDYLAGRGTLLSTWIPGSSSGVRTTRALIYLPSEYGNPAYAHRVFPAVELFSGFYGSPWSWVRALHITTMLDQAITSGTSVPFIAVIPMINVAYPRDTECVNVVSGPQVDTYLTLDVRAAVDAQVRADPLPGAWAALGYSTGGYCAVNLAMRHPDMFSAAASLSGYIAAAHDATTGSLFHGEAVPAEQNNDVWRATHMHDLNLHLLLVSTKQDRSAYLAGQALAAAAKPPLRVWTLTLPRGGHNASVWDAELPTALGWLSRWVSEPLTPVPAVDGQLPEPVGPAAGGGQPTPVSALGRYHGAPTSSRNLLKHGQT